GSGAQSSSSARLPSSSAAALDCIWANGSSTWGETSSASARAIPSSSRRADSAIAVQVGHDVAQEVGLLAAERRVPEAPRVSTREQRGGNVEHHRGSYVVEHEPELE